MKPKRILQIGYGSFGAVHLRAWQALGAEVTVAEPSPQARAGAMAAVPGIATVADYRAALAGCDAVDIVTPSDTHHAIACAVLDAGKPVLIEKPIVVSLAQAQDLAARAKRAHVVVRGGYYFRYHPKTIGLRDLMARHALGQIRFVSGKFAGIKRTRADAGALLNDAVHFLDLFVWLLAAAPVSLYAVTRDHFDRGLEDFALLTLQFADGAVAQIETGTIQPGRWPDAVVPGAITSKEISVSGSLGLVEIDYAAETMNHRAVRHIDRDGVWQPEFSATAPLVVGSADPVAVVSAELRAFLNAIDSGSDSSDDGLDGGVILAGLLEAAQRSASSGQAVQLK